MNTAVTKEPFSLAGMGEMLRETNADLAGKVGVDEVEPPQVEASPDPADAPPENADTPEAETQPETKSKPDDAAPSGAPTEAELQAEQQRQKEETDAATAQKEKDAAAKSGDKDAEAQRKAAEEAAKNSPEQKAREQRDADLRDQLSPHTHPKTRKVIEAKNAKIQAARDERDRIIAEREALKAERDQLAEKAKGTVLPKEVDEELKTLRTRVRELDITRDPQLEAKYDRPIAANTKSVIEMLKSFGADQIADPKDQTKTIADARFEANLMRSGLSLKTLQPFIEKLDKAGYVDEAEALRESIRENGRLARAKQQEIEAWKGDYDTRLKARDQQTQQQSEAESRALATEAENALKTDLAELAKTFPYLNPPPAPLPTDADPVRKAKQQALDEYNAASKSVEAAVNAFNPQGQSPEKARSAVARLNASAVQGVILKQHLLPRLLKDAATKDARIKELETQLGKFRGASTLSRQHATLANQAPGNNQPAEIPAGAPTTDAFSQFAKSAGININS